MTVRQRQPRIEDRKYLAAVRQLPCLVCRRSPCDAAHIRMADEHRSKPPTGIGERPSDRWAVPLCHECHMKQHRSGERQWWIDQGFDPIGIAMTLYENRDDIEEMKKICLFC